MAKKTAKRATKKSPAKSANAGFGDIASIWDTAKQKASTRNSYSEPEIDDGQYVARITDAKLAQTRKDKSWYVRFSYVVLFGDFGGTELSSMDMLTDSPVGDTGLTQIDLFKQRLESMDIDPTKLTAQQFPQLMEHIKDEGPCVAITVANKYYTKSNGDEGHRVNVYVNNPVTEDEIDELSETFGEPFDTDAE